MEAAKSVAARPSGGSGMVAARFRRFPVSGAPPGRPGAGTRLDLCGGDLACGPVEGGASSVKCTDDGWLAGFGGAPHPAGARLPSSLAAGLSVCAQG